MLIRLLLSFLFLISGMSALAYQVVWQKVLTQEIGVDTLSISFIVAIFLAGIGLGSWLHRSTLNLSFTQKRSLFVALELGIGVFGIASIVILRGINQSAFAGTSTLSQFVMNLAVLLPATMAMG